MTWNEFHELWDYEGTDYMMHEVSHHTVPQELSAAHAALENAHDEWRNLIGKHPHE